MVNAELIEWIERTPDTVISLTTGEKLVVREPVSTVVNRAITYRQRVSRRLRWRTPRLKEFVGGD